MDEETQPSSPVAVNDGADDVVETDVADTDSQTSHLVEGDIFPAEAPPVVESEGSVNDADEINVEEIAAEAEAAVAAAASASSTPPKPVVPPSRKRVRWVDGVRDSAAPHGLVKHVTSFYMPHSSRGSRVDAAEASSPTRPSHAAAVNPTPAVFREKVNADGSTYKFCKAQRPALRFAQWKREQHEYGLTPFDRQPLAGNVGPSATAPPASDDAVPQTLFGLLYQRSFVTRAPEGHVQTSAATHHSGHAESYQLPFIRVDAVVDAPYDIQIGPHPKQTPAEMKR